MTEGVCRLVERVEPGRVFVVEEGGIWFSGMNAYSAHLAKRVKRLLESEGYTVGEVRDDEAVRFGGVFLPVEEAEAIDDDLHRSIVSPPGGVANEESGEGGSRRDPQATEQREEAERGEARP